MVLGILLAQASGNGTFLQGLTSLQIKSTPSSASWALPPLSSSAVSIYLDMETWAPHTVLPRAVSASAAWLS